MTAGQAQVAAAWRFSRCLHVSFGEVDHLKRLNNCYGHAVGDANESMYRAKGRRSPPPSECSK